MTNLNENPTLSLGAIEIALRDYKPTQFILVISEKLIDIAEQMQIDRRNMFIYRVHKDWTGVEWQINDCGNTEIYFSKGDESK